jgi:hypothetical protein
MRRLRQLVRRHSHRAILLLALAGQLVGAGGLPVRSAAPPPQPEPAVVAARSPAKPCCCSGGGTDTPCCCCCSAEPAAAPESESEAPVRLKWVLTVTAAHCDGHGPSAPGSLPPALPLKPTGPDRFAAAPAGWLADLSTSPVRVILPRPTPPPRLV